MHPKQSDAQKWPNISHRLPDHATQILNLISNKTVTQSDHHDHYLSNASSALLEQIKLGTRDEGHFCYINLCIYANGIFVKMQIYQLNIGKYDQLLNLYTYMHISHFHFPKHLSVSSRNVMSRSVDILSDALPEQKPKLSFSVKLFDLQFFQPIFLFPMHIQQYYTKNNFLMVV